MTQQASVKELLTLRVPPIGIGFFSEPPAGVEHYGDGQAPAGCSFWQRAQEGHVFYATAEDQGCAVGLYTPTSPRRRRLWAISRTRSG